MDKAKFIAKELASDPDLFQRALDMCLEKINKRTHHFRIRFKSRFGEECDVFQIMDLEDRLKKGHGVYHKKGNVEFENREVRKIRFKGRNSYVVYDRTTFSVITIMPARWRSRRYRLENLLNEVE